MNTQLHTSHIKKIRKHIPLHTHIYNIIYTYNYILTIMNRGIGDIPWYPLFSVNVSLPAKGRCPAFVSMRSRIGRLLLPKGSLAEKVSSSKTEIRSSWPQMKLEKIRGNSCSRKYQQVEKYQNQFHRISLLIEANYHRFLRDPVGTGQLFPWSFQLGIRLVG